MTYVTEVLADTPAAYWRLGEAAGPTADDSVGSVDGTYANCTLAAAGALAGDADTAVGFNGTTSSILVPATLPTFAGAALSCDAWIKISNLSKVGHMIVGAYNVVGSNQGWGFIFNQGTADHKLAYLDTTAVAWVKSTGTINDNEWHHVGFTITSGGALTFYIDGQSAGTAAAHAPNTYAGTKRLGAQANAGGAFLAGSLDEPAVYASGLSAARILAHYEAGIADPTPALVRHVGEPANQALVTPGRRAALVVPAGLRAAAITAAARHAMVSPTLAASASVTARSSNRAAVTSQPHRAALVTANDRGAG